MPKIEHSCKSRARARNTEYGLRRIISLSGREVQAAGTRRRPRTGIVSRPPLEHIQLGVNTLITKSVAENTWETYNTALNTFNEFRDSYNLDKNWPARFQHIVFFISFCFEQGLSPKSIKTYISGLNFFHKMHGWYDIGEQFIVKKLLEGCARLRKTKDSRAPITLKILQTLRAQLSKVCYNEYETKLFSAFGS